MSLERLTQITEVGIQSGITLRNLNIENSSGISTFNNLKISNGLYDSNNSVGASGQILSSTGSQTAWINASTTNVGSATSIGINLDSTNATRYITFSGTTSGNNLIYVDSDLTYNPSNNTFTSSNFSGNLTGNVNSSGVSTFSGGIQGNVTGNLTGNVTGNVNSSGVSTFSGGINVGDSFIRNNFIGLGQTDTAGRNAGVGTAVGTLVFNNTSGTLEVYNGNIWVALQRNFDATGGTITFANGKKIHTFTGSGTFTVNVGYTEVEYLVVAGGGAGGSDRGGGGGAGALRYATGLFVSASPGSYTVTVGAGGGLGANPEGSTGQNGSPSSFGPITSSGGGGGGGEATAASPGGSGGGGSYQTPNTGAPATGSPGGTSESTSPASGWGNSGGTGTLGSPRISAGGGGAGSVGGNGSVPTSGAGGNGLSYSISGASVTYAGGGGGGATNGDPAGSAGPGPEGPGGGGAGGNGPGSTPGTTGTVNTGGGGGGGGFAGTGTGGIGGSGIVIIAYPA